MVDHLEVRPGVYHDSVRLMQVSRGVGDVDGVAAALVAMGTELNLDVLDGMGFAPPDAGPNDLVVAIRADEPDAVERALGALAEVLAAPATAGRGLADESSPRTTASALRGGDADLVLVSVPGEHAAVEAHDALDAGRHVMVFSDNVPVDQEVALKARGRDLGLLVMGPDCGTAIVAGVGLGFANVVRPGPVGIVAASGTGAQQLCCLLDDAGIGISHVLGVGGRDLSTAVGGIATMQAMAALDDDPATEVVVVLSKPPDPAVAEAITRTAQGLSTPVVSGFIGSGGDDLTAVARQAAAAVGGTALDPRHWGARRPNDAVRRRPPEPSDAAAAGNRVSPRDRRPGSLQGWFAGGTLAVEALTVARSALDPVRSNVGAGADPELDLDARGHLVVDLGEDQYTRGRPHPMIDQQLRLERIAAAGADPEVGVLLLDVVLGHGAHPDPAGELAPAVAEARDRAARDDRDLAVVVSLCGTAGDPQDRDAQARRLVEAGASVHASNVEAARTAVDLIAPSAGAP